MKKLFIIIISIILIVFFCSCGFNNVSSNYDYTQISNKINSEIQRNIEAENSTESEQELDLSDYDYTSTWSCDRLWVHKDTSNYQKKSGEWICLDRKGNEIYSYDGVGTYEDEEENGVIPDDFDQGFSLIGTNTIINTDGKVVANVDIKFEKDRFHDYPRRKYWREFDENGIAVFFSQDMYSSDCSELCFAKSNGKELEIINTSEVNEFTTGYENSSEKSIGWGLSLDVFLGKNEYFDMIYFGELDTHGVGKFSDGYIAVKSDYFTGYLEENGKIALDLSYNSKIFDKLLSENICTGIFMLCNAENDTFKLKFSGKDEKMYYVVLDKNGDIVKSPYLA